MAEAFFDEMAQSRWRSLSAGTISALCINPLVVEAMREVGIDAAQRQPTLLTRDMIDQARRIITMGCSVEDLHLAVSVPADEWELDDPQGQSLEKVREIRDQVRVKVSQLLRELESC